MISTGLFIEFALLEYKQNRKKGLTVYMYKINFAKILLWRGEERGGWKRGEEEKKAGGGNEMRHLSSLQ